ncbi:hypothetical protein CASFOL_012493 [Castilleja foliolosa]|uniref:Replication factor A C-terminal domain-containing protein n=1 Tax=Castilleja foliolosa TaxID=1961234 RepID=A0ABD3DHF5_9LAMI
MPIARSVKWENDMEFHDVFPIFSQKAAQVSSIKWLTRMMDEDDKKHWIYETVVGVETTKPFWYLACFNCGKGVQVVDGRQLCFHCGQETISDIYKYDLDVVVADGTGVINLSLSHGASTRLIEEDTRDVIAYQGLRVKTLPTFIEDEILGKCALFEVIFRSTSAAVRRFNVSRLSQDVEVLEQYDLKYLPKPKEKEEVEAGGRCKEAPKRRRIV